MLPCTPSPCCRAARGHALAESLCALLVVSIGLIPLASLAATGLGWLRGHEQLALAMRTAGEFVETSGLEVAPMNRSIPVSAEGCPALPDMGQSICPRAGKLAIARLAIGEPGSSATLLGIALWLQP